MFKTLATVTVDNVTGIASMCGGPKWGVSPAEREPMIAAWAAYYEARGVSDMPPEVMLAGTMIAYVAQRVTLSEIRQLVARTTRRPSPAPPPSPERPPGRTPSSPDVPIEPGELH